MTDTKLPNPLPAGSVVFVPEEWPTEVKGEGYYIMADDRETVRISQIRDRGALRLHYRRFALTAPLHHLTPPVVEEPRTDYGLDLGTTHGRALKEQIEARIKWIVKVEIDALAKEVRNGR